MKLQAETLQDSFKPPDGRIELKNDAVAFDPAAPATKVRVAKVKDAVPLGAFFMRSWVEAGPGALGFTGATEKDIREIASEEFLSMRLANPTNRFVVAERGGNIVGFASVRMIGKKRAELSGIVVLESETGKALGTRMVQRAFDVAVRLGAERLIVKTEVFNERAIGFYTKNGFAQKGTATEKGGKKNIPTVVLEKRLRRLAGLRASKN